MHMESEEVLLNGGASNGGAISYGNGVKQVNGVNGFEHVGGNDIVKGSLADEVLEDLEEYWEDINDRLMISRMVGDSVIKGMVSAVEQDAAEKIRTKETEVANFKERIQSLGLGIDEFEPVSFLSFNDTELEHHKMREDLHTFRNVAIDEIEKAKEEIDCARGSNFTKQIGSSSELVGLGGILQEKQPENCSNLDKMLENLKSTVDTFCSKTDSILVSSKTRLCELQHELELSRNIEDMVTQSVLKSVLEEFEENWTAQNAQSCGINSVNWLEKFNDVSNLRTQLDSVLKSLSISEAGLVSHGSLDFDNSPHKATLHTVVSFPEENGTSEASGIHVAESYDFQQLKHMSNKELVKYFNNIITNLKRTHESALHEQAEKYFRLKREYRGPFMAHRKDEEFDVLRKKIPEVILKLENFLLESERIPTPMVDIESIGKLNDKVECLLSENCTLRDILTNKENEVKHLEALVSESAGKLLHHSLTEENLRKLVAELKSAVEDSCIEASLNEEVYKCALKELIGQKRSDYENSEMELLLMRETYDIILRAASNSAESRGTYDLEDSDIESSVVHGVSALIFREAIKNAEGELNNLHQEVLIEKQNRISLETKVLEKENELRLDIEEKDRLKQEILSLGITLEQKEKLAVDLSNSLSKEREKFQLAFEQLCSLTENLSRQQSLVAETNKQRESLSTKFQEALEQIEVYKTEVHKINEVQQKLDQTKAVLTEASKERDVAFALAQERLDKFLLSEAREKKLKREMELSTDNIHGLMKIFDNFECRISRAISNNNIRLEEATSQLTELTDMASVLRTTELVYKQKLERKCADLKTAETEVDLLGDEVDDLLRLLEKIYIALDHYSPILKHYPGIIEILQLVKKELSGESTKRSQSTAWKG